MFCTNIIKYNTSFVSPEVLILQFFYFKKVSIIRCDKYIFLETAHGLLNPLNMALATTTFRNVAFQRLNPRPHLSIQSGSCSRNKLTSTAAYRCGHPQPLPAVYLFLVCCPSFGHNRHLLNLKYQFFFIFAVKFKLCVLNFSAYL